MICCRSDGPTATSGTCRSAASDSPMATFTVAAKIGTVFESASGQRLPERVQSTMTIRPCRAMTGSRCLRSETGSERRSAQVRPAQRERPRSVMPVDGLEARRERAVPRWVHEPPAVPQVRTHRQRGVHGPLGAEHVEHSRDTTGVGVVGAQSVGNRGTQSPPQLSRVHAPT